MTEAVYDIRQFFRRAFRAGLIDGPTFRNLDGRDGCWTQEVQFQLAVGDPYLWSDLETVCLDDVALTAGNTVCCLVEAKHVDEVANLVIEADAATSLEVTFTPTAGVVCPAAEAAEFSFSIPSMSAGDVLTVDSVARSVTYYDASADESHPGMEFINFSGVFKWFDVYKDSNACVCVEAGGGVGASRVTVMTRTREL